MYDGSKRETFLFFVSQALLKPKFTKEKPAATQYQLQAAAEH
jgi:hypothetical protein